MRNYRESSEEAILLKSEAIRKLKEIDNGMVTVKIEDGKVVSISVQRNDMQYREG